MLGPPPAPCGLTGAAVPGASSPRGWQTLSLTLRVGLWTRVGKGPVTPGPTKFAAGQSALPRTQASLSKTGGRSGHRPSRARPSVWGSDLEVPLWTGAPPWGTSSACLGPPRGVCLGLCHHVPSELQNAADTPVHLQGGCAGAGRWEWGWGWHACQPPFLPLILRARCFPAQVLTGERPAEEGRGRL